MLDLRQNLRRSSLIEHPPPTLYPPVRAGLFDRLFVGLLRPAWYWRTELGALGLVAGLWHLLSGLFGGVLAAGALGLCAGGLARSAACRRWAIALFYRSHVRRRFLLALRHAGLATYNDRVGRIIRIEQVPAGDRLKLRMPAGRRVQDLEDAAEIIAAFLGVFEVRVERDPQNARIATVLVVRRDSFDSHNAASWPNRDATELSLWDEIPVGLDEEGEEVCVSLVERNLLIGGEPGAGKSAALSLLIATAALDPSVELTLLDGKRVEFAPWSSSAVRIVGPDPAEAIEALRGLREEMERRYLTLLANRRRKVSPSDGCPLQVVACDELALFLTGPDKDKRSEFAELLRDLVSRGRAAGIIVLAATQKPAHEIVPTALRDLFGFRWALRSNTPQASDTILGQGWASLGYSASEIAGSQRGVGFLLAEEERPIKLKSFYLADSDVAEIAERASFLRQGTHEIEELSR